MSNEKNKTQEPFNPDISNITESEQYRQEMAEQRAEDDANVSTWQRFCRKLTPLRRGTGLTLIIIGIYLLLSFISFIIYAGKSDQSRIATYTLRENARQADEIHNIGAAFGASVSDFLIASGVGLAAFIIVIWCIVMGVRLMKKNSKLHYFRFTLVCLLSIFAWSIIIDAIGLLLPSMWFPIGGYFGYYINRWLLDLVGLYGMIATNIVIFVIWVLLCYNTLRSIYNRLPKRKNKKATTTEREKSDYKLGEFRGGTITEKSPRYEEPAPMNERDEAASAMPNHEAGTAEQNDLDIPAPDMEPPRSRL